MDEVESTMVTATTNHAKYVIKRDGRKEEFDIMKITFLIRGLCSDTDETFIDPAKVAKHTMERFFSGMNTTALLDLLAETAAVLASFNPHYNLLATRIAVTKLHKETNEKFTDVITDLYNVVNEHTNEKSPLISDFHYNVITKNADRLNAAIIHERDFSFSYLSLKTLEKFYLLKLNGKTAERPQHMLMRVAVGIHDEDIDAAIETYNTLSSKYFTHSSSTLKNAATPQAQLSSGFVMAMQEDSIEGIFNSLSACAVISKYSGNVGLHIHCIRATNSYILSTNGTSNGLVPMLRVYDATAKYVRRGEDMKPGAFAIYLEPWHADIFEFLELRRDTGKEEKTANELYYALWIPDEFMRRVESNSSWSLMCPNSCPGLSDSYGETFDNLYRKYEEEKRYVRQVDARELWCAILYSQMKTGMPYVLYKDACNKKSNQQNIGTIKGSNLCAEIIEYSAPEEIAVNNFASIAVNMFVTAKKTYDFGKLKEIAKIVTKNLNRIIDVNFSVLTEAKKSNLTHRSVAIGVQGLADLFLLMRLPFDSEKSQLLNVQIFETIYYGALEASCELARKFGAYETYDGSPMSKGILQYDMWEVEPTSLWNWNELKAKIRQYGVRNSLLVACMPTISTAQILGNSRSFEPYTSNVYVAGNISDKIPIINPYLVQDLLDRGLWDEDMRKELLMNKGSVQYIDRVPDDLKVLYRTVWEIRHKILLKMAASRAPFIDQSQHLNVYIAQPNFSDLSSMHFDGWRMGLKTGMCFLKSRISM